MGNKFAEIAFTPKVQDLQEAMGSRKAYSKFEQGRNFNEVLGADEVAFIAARDSFYMASVSETGWPYVQHRGGPAGFLKVLDSKTLGFADYRGNRQYVSTGNLSNNDRISMILVDDPNRQRLKIMGHVTIVHPEETEMLKKLESPGYAARVERGFRIAVAAFDWNCPQHITPRFTEAEVEAVVGPLQERLVQLEKELEDCAAPRSF
jgi:uncharacterized protein